jgi:hypothetical protein
MRPSKVNEVKTIAAVAEGYSLLTLAAFHSTLNVMKEFIGDEEISGISPEDLLGFINYLVTENNPERRNNPVILNLSHLLKQ